VVSVNEVILVGLRVGDAELRRGPAGQEVASISVASTVPRKARQIGVAVGATQCHRGTFFGRLAEAYLRKVDSVLHARGSCSFFDHLFKTLIVFIMI